MTYCIKMELILYYIIESRNLLISFLILMFFIGMIGFIAMRNFRQDKKSKIIFYGLFLKMNNIDILKMASVIIKTFLVFYGSLVTDQTQIMICLIMMMIVTVIYIVCYPKKIIYESGCTVVQMAMIYFIYLINNYSVEIENTLIILTIKIFLIIFALMFTTYLLFREIDIISKNRVDKRFQKENKKTKNAEEGID